MATYIFTVRELINFANGQTYYQTQIGTQNLVGLPSAPATSEADALDIVQANGYSPVFLRGYLGTAEWILTK
jgi:hypothetical protein